MASENGHDEIFERIKSKAYNDPAYRNLPPEEALERYMKDHADDPDVVAHKNAEPSPPMSGLVDEADEE